jgi:plastocyanin
VSATSAGSEAPPSPAPSPAAGASPTSARDPDRSQPRRQAITVGTVDDAFRPARITVDVGATVSWTNSGQNPHTVTADGGSFGSATLENGDTFSRTFAAAGTFAYHCRFHGGPGGSGMSGVVIVLAADGGDTVPGDGGPAEVPDTADLPATGFDGAATVAASIVLAMLGIASVMLGRRAPRRIR